jgi:subtilase family serine protease
MKYSHRQNVLGRYGFTCALLILVALLPVLPPAARAQTAQAVPAQRMVGGAINEAVRTRLHGNTRPEARAAANDRGLVDDAMPLPHMQLQLRRPADREQALMTLIDQLHDPKSPNFHQWLTPTAFGERFGPAAADIAAVTDWLEQKGFTVNFVYPSGMAIDYSGTAGQVHTAFHTELHRLSVNGVAHFANMGDPEIPAALAPVVVGVVALHDFKPRAHQVPQTAHPNASDGNGNFWLAPSDLATIYNFNPLYNAGYSGQGQTIAVVEPTNLFSDDDWTTFRQTFGLSVYTAGSLTTIHPAPPFGTTNCTDPGVVHLDTGEAALDAEYASAGAPSAAIILASCKDTATIDAELTAIQNLTNSNNHPFVISDSYGTCEAFNGATSNAAYYAIFQQGVAEGISYFVAAGDENAASCDYQMPIATHGINVDAEAATPFAVATGGTDFSDTFHGTNSTYWSSTNTPSHGSALSYIPEIPWNDTCASELTATWFGFQTTYGSNGLCSSQTGSTLLAVDGGSGGPSACATGAPSVSGVASAPGSTCAGWPKPSWQAGLLGNPNDTVRDIPDVSLFASDNAWNHIYIYCNSDYDACGSNVFRWSRSGGTSFTAPIFAGIQALINQYTGSPQGLPNYVYYKIAAAEYGIGGNSTCNSSRGTGVNPGCVFYDVTEGDMNAPCKPDLDSGFAYNCFMSDGTIGVMSTDNNSYQPAYKTGVGWDFATGIGTVNVTNLVMNWVSAGGGSAGLTVSVVGSGTVTSLKKYGIDCPSACSATMAGGPAVTLTATPATSGAWVFSGWSGACSGAGTCQVTVDAAKSVTATFVQGFTLSTSVSGSGTVTSSPGSINCPTTCSDGYAANAAVTLTATPADGWSFAGWNGAGCGSTGSCMVTMNQAQSVTATFAQITYTLSVGVAGNGGVTSTPSGIDCGSVCSADFLSGTQVTLVASPAGGAVFNGWAGACSGSGSCTVTVNSLENVTAMFSSPGGSSPVSQTWVSASLGNDANPCTFEAPCRNFAAALALTQPGGEIDVLDPGGYGPLTITQSVSIQGDQVGPSGTSSIVVSAGASDVVSLRGLTFSGAGTSGVSGIQFNSGAHLIVEDCALQGFGVAGILFSPGSGSAATAEMDVRNTTIANNTSGVLVKPTGGVAARVTLKGASIVNNIGGGLKADGTGGSGAIDVTIANGNVSFNGGNGINAVSGQGSVAVKVVRITITSNGVAGVQSNQSNGGMASVTVGNSTIASNALGLSAVAGGSLLSNGTNDVTGNPTNGNFTGIANLQ